MCTAVAAHCVVKLVKLLQTTLAVGTAEERRLQPLGFSCVLSEHEHVQLSALPPVESGDLKNLITLMKLYSVGMPLFAKCVLYKDIFKYINTYLFIFFKSIIVGMENGRVRDPKIHIPTSWPVHTSQGKTGRRR